jgi:hypothetical protein
MTEHYLTIEQNWRILIESFGEARQSTRETTEVSPDTRNELLTRLDALETTLRALESCWRPIRERLPVAAEPTLEVPQTTPQREYLLPLLRVLCEQGGRVRAREAVQATLGLMKPRLLPRDFEPTETGRIRYDTAIRFARETLKQRGLLKPSSSDGHWEVTDAGRRAHENCNVDVAPVPPPDPTQMDFKQMDFFS